MEPAEDRERDELPVDGALRRHRCLQAEPLVRACAVVVADVLGDDARGAKNPNIPLTAAAAPSPKSLQELGRFERTERDS